MAIAKKGDKVRINYTGSLEDGTIIDTTLDTGCCEDDDCGCGDAGGLADDDSYVGCAVGSDGGAGDPSRDVGTGWGGVEGGGGSESGADLEERLGLLLGLVDC